MRATPIAQRNVTTNVTANTSASVATRVIRVGNTMQAVDYPRQARPLSVIVNSALPARLSSMNSWQVRPEETALLNDLGNPQLRILGIWAASGYGKSSLAARIYQQATGFERKLWANFQEPVSFGVFAHWLMQRLLGSQRYSRMQKQLAQSSDGELRRRVLHQLRQMRCLLVLDHLETLFQDEILWKSYGDFLASWLGEDGGGKIILSSQFRLALPTKAWRWYSLAGLSRPQGTALLQQQGIAGSRSDLEAFVESAEGNPLLLTIAAQEIRQSRLDPQNHQANITPIPLQPDDLWQLSELKARHPDNPEARIARLLDRQLDQLQPGWLRSLLCRLSVLRQGFELETAQAFVDETLTLEDLQQLAARNFLQEHRLPEDTRIFSFLPSIQRYFQSVGAEAGEKVIAHRRAIAYFLWKRIPDASDVSAAQPTFELFHHWCELGDYLSASQVLDSCDHPFKATGHERILLSLYRQLTKGWLTIPNFGEAPSKHQEKMEQLGWAWTRQGELSQHLGYYQAAMQAHQQAQQLFRQIESPAEATAFSHLGAAHEALGQYLSALRCYEEQWTLSQTAGDRQGEASALGNLGRTHQGLGQYPQAIQCYEQQRSIAQAIGDHPNQASALGQMGNTCWSLGQYQRSIGYQKQSLAIYRKIGDRQQEATSLSNLGSAYYSLGYYQRTIKHQQQSLNLNRDLGNDAGQASALAELGQAYSALGQNQRAIEFHLQQRTLAQETGNLCGETSALEQLSHAYYALGDYHRSIQFCQQHHRLAQILDRPQDEANALGNLGNAYYALGEYERAIEGYRQCRDLLREIGDRQGEASSLGNLGGTYLSLKKYQEAVDFQFQSLKIRREIGDRWGQGASLFNLGLVWANLKEWQKAKPLFEEARDLFRELKLPSIAGHCEVAIAKLQVPSHANTSRLAQKRWLLYGGMAVAVAAFAILLR